MKQILHKKTRKPSHKEIERVQLGCTIFKVVNHLMGY
ncbi:Uncharacterised protein [Streptococcus pneumoniae]|nr:Uncharacterised protein [Streptococcus pneumoniae]